MSIMTYNKYYNIISAKMKEALRTNNYFRRVAHQSKHFVVHKNETFLRICPDIPIFTKNRSQGIYFLSYMW